MILKFDTNLALEWATNFLTSGGNASRLITDPFGNLYITGVAKDTALPLRDPGSGTYMDTTFSGTSDAYIAKFDSNDSLIWCTYFGGSGVESGSGIAFNGDLFLTGTTSSSDLPFVYNNTMFIDSVLSGTNDLFIARFKANGSQFWTTYYGGSAGTEDGITRIVCDNAGNFYVSGGTTSNNFPCQASPFVYSDTVYNGGTRDAVVLAFNAQNQRKWASYFGGTMDEGAAYCMDIFGDSILYIAGSTGTNHQQAIPFPLQNLGGGAWWQPTMNTAAIYNATISRFLLDQLILLSADEFTTHTNYASMLVYPNPGSGEFQVLINSDAENRRIEVYNTIGQVVKTKKIPDGVSELVISLNLSELASGVYVVVLADNNGLTSKRVIKQ